MPDDARIHSIIQNALDNHSLDTSSHAPALSVASRIRNSWTWVMRQRDAGACDEDWAIADHYLNARYAAATGDSAARWTLMSLTYNFVKLLSEIGDGLANVVSTPLVGRQVNLIGPSQPARNLMAKGRCIVSPPSLAAISWARRGALDGTNDRTNVAHTQRLIAPTNP